RGRRPRVSFAQANQVRHRLSRWRLGPRAFEERMAGGAMSRKKNPYAGDARTRQAKAQGYPARSVFKLDEIDRRVGLLRPGQRVLDLGAAPGSWSLYASRRIGDEGCVLAV